MNIGDTREIEYTLVPIAKGNQIFWNTSIYMSDVNSAIPLSSLREAP